MGEYYTEVAAKSDVSTEVVPKVQADDTVESERMRPGLGLPNPFPEPRPPFPGPRPPFPEPEPRPPFPGPRPPFPEPEPRPPFPGPRPPFPEPEPRPPFPGPRPPYPGPEPRPPFPPTPIPYPQPEPNPEFRPPAPKGAPPRMTPTQSPGLRAIDPGAIRQCMYTYVYIWLENGQNFWFYPTFVGRRSISGYRWTRFGWAYTGFDLDMIQSFYCYR